MSFFTDLPITEIAILNTLPRFEDCLEVEGWLKTGNKGHSFQAWLSPKALPTFLPVLLIRNRAECHLIKDVTMRKLLISPAKMTQLSLSLVQHLGCVYTCPDIRISGYPDLRGPYIFGRLDVSDRNVFGVYTRPDILIHYTRHNRYVLEKYANAFFLSRCMPSNSLPFFLSFRWCLLAGRQGQNFVW